MFEIIQFSDVSGIQNPSWDYTQDTQLERLFPAPTIETTPNFKGINKQPRWQGEDSYKESPYVITGPSLPYLPPKVMKLIKRGREKALSENDFSKLMVNIANISISFYKLKKGKYVAIGLNGRVVEIGNSQLELLSKIQGKKYSTQIFVWQVGADVFSGWTQ